MTEVKTDNATTSQKAAPAASSMALAIILGVVGAVLLALVISWWQPMQSANHFQSNFQEKLDLASSLVSEIEDNQDAVTDRYDVSYQGKADTVALYARTKAGFGYTDAELSQLFELMSVSSVFAVDDQGQIVAQCGQTSGLSKHVAQAATAALASADTPQPFTADVAGTSMRFYAAKADSSHAIVVAEQTSQIAASSEKLASVATELSDVSVGRTGFVAAINADGTIAYHANQELIGKSASEIGLTDAQLANDYQGDVTMDGVSYLARTRTCGSYTLISVLPYSEFNSFTGTFIGINVCIYAVAVLILLSFLYFSKTDKRRNGEKAARATARAIPLGVGCLLFVLVASFYLTTLVEVSSMMSSNDQHAQAAKTEIQAADATLATIDDETTKFVEDRAALAAYILPRLDSSQLTRSFMIELRDALACECVWYFDMNGDTIATDNDFWGYRLSDDPTSFSYQFREVLQGRKSEVVCTSEGTTSDWSVTKYVGYAVQDDNLRTTGMVEVGSDQTLVNNMKSLVSFSSILRTVQPGNNAFAFAVNAESGTFTYHPNSNLIGEKATDHGIAETSLKADLNDFITINGQTYLCASEAVDGEYIFVANPVSAATTLSLPVTGATTVFCAIWFIILLICANARSRKLDADANAASKANTDNAEVTDVEVDGRTKTTTTVFSRWSTRGISWENRTPGQKTGKLVHWLLTALAVIVLVAFLFSNQLFDESSLFYCILNGSWEPGLNLFAVSRCIVVVLVAYAVMDIARALLQWFAENLTAKGETICRLLENLLKFVFWVGIIYYCMATLGADTSVLLTSAGILTLVVGLGANSLITDVIAGLFIVFEGEFQVGDIVSVGDFRGTVQEIGIRTTKIKGGDSNIKVFANRNLTGVVNMTKDLSSVSCTFSFPGTMSLERMETALSNELPKLQERLPKIVSGPFYRGVSSIGDSVELQIVAKCHEADKGQLERDLNREIRLIVEKLLLGPDAQANALERIQAERFSDQQTDAASDITLETDN